MKNILSLIGIGQLNSMTKLWCVMQKALTFPMSTYYSFWFDQAHKFRRKNSTQVSS